MSGLRVSVGWNGRRVDHVHVVSARPAAQPLLVGRTPDQAIAWIPRLFSLCGKAQQAAARLALAGARGESAEADPATLRGVLAEQAQEHLWRVLRDWPRCLGLPPRDADFAGWFRRLAAADEQAGADLLAYVEKEILGRPVDPWMALGCRDEIAAWAKFGSGGNAHGGRLAAALLDADGGTGEARCLPLRPDFAAFEAVDWSGEFPQRPTWEGAPAETGAYGRWRAQPMVAASGDGLLARLLARLLDLVVTARRLSQPEPQATLAEGRGVADNVGLARIDTARGMLLHRVEMAGGRVHGYAVVAPTEWNFHPQGGFAAAVARLSATGEDELRRRIGCWLTAFDPCVEWTLDVRRT